MRRKFLALLTVFVLLAAVPAFAQDEAPGLEGVTADAVPYWGQTVTLEGVIVEYLNSYIFVLGEGAALDDDRVLVINDMGQPFPASLIRGERVSVTGVVLPSFDARANDANAAPFVDSVFSDTTRFSRGMGGLANTDGMNDGLTDADQTSDATILVGTPMPETPLPENVPTDDPNAIPTIDPAVATTDPNLATVDPNMIPTPDPSLMATPDMSMTGVAGGGSAAGGGMSGMGIVWEDAVVFYFNGSLPAEFNTYTILLLSDVNNITHIVTD